MNKAELVDSLSNKAGLTKQQSEKALSAILETIQEALAGGHEVKILGFGTFDRAVRRARNGRNPRTGDAIVLPEMRVPRFRPGKEFKELVR